MRPGHNAAYGNRIVIVHGSSSTRARRECPAPVARATGLTDQVIAMQLTCHQPRPLALESTSLASSPEEGGFHTKRTMSGAVIVSSCGRSGCWWAGRAVVNSDVGILQCKESWHDQGIDKDGLRPRGGRSSGGR